jgi:hypothetical protein
MVHVVKGRRYSAYTVHYSTAYAGASIAEMASETDRLSISIVTSFDASYTWTSSTEQYNVELQIGRSWYAVLCVLYIAQGYIFIYPQDYVSQENA